MDSRGRLIELIEGALKRNSGNLLLVQCGIDFGLLTAKHSVELPPLVKFGDAPVAPDGILFTHKQCKLITQDADYYREEMYIATQDARLWGIYEESVHAVLAIQTLSLDKPVQSVAVRVIVSERITSGNVHINRHFCESIGLFSLFSSEGRPWSVRVAKNIVPIKEIVFELMVERSKVDTEIRDLRRQRQEFFWQRCLLVEQNYSLRSLSLPVLGRAYFNIYALQPSLQELEPGTLLLLDEKTTLQLLVPHSKNSVDMVIIVDVSGSMDTRDYIGTDNRPHSRLDGVRVALETLVHRRLVSGSRVSRLAIVVFGANSAMLYPVQPTMADLSSIEQIQEIRANLRLKLNPQGLRELKVHRSPTNISAVLSYTAYLLDSCFQEGNEKIFVLLSDGADWDDKSADDERYGELVSSVQDPAALADSLHYSSNIRIHTVAISDEQSYRSYVEAQSGTTVPNTAPNTALLRKIASLTDGIYFESPDAKSLNNLFDEVGKGTKYFLT
jgi:hypothetical protein